MSGCLENFESLNYGEYMSNKVQENNIKIGEWYKVKDFEHGQRPVKVIEPITDKPGYYWAKYSDGAVYDFHYSELKDI
jgi:hypothetical protein